MFLSKVTVLCVFQYAPFSISTEVLQHFSEMILLEVWHILKCENVSEVLESEMHSFFGQMSCLMLTLIF